MKLKKNAAKWTWLFCALLLLGTLSIGSAGCTDDPINGPVLTDDNSNPDNTGDGDTGSN